MKTLKDRVAVVTGAASGIGKAVALDLAAAGCDVAAVDRDRAGLASVAESIRQRGRRASTHEIDLADRTGLAALPGEVIALHGRVHILVNNAGVALAGTLAENSIDDLDWIVDVNFWGVVLGCKHFLPHLAEQDEAHIVNLSSLFGLIGLPGVGAYCATKAAVRSYSETLRAELRGSGVGVTSVHPGGVRTNIMRNARMDDETGRDEAVALFNRLGVTPERAAARIVTAIRRNEPRLRICRETYLADWLIRLAPVSVDRVVAWAWQRSEARRRSQTRATP